MGYFDKSETFKQSCPGGIKKEPIVGSPSSVPLSLRLVSRFNPVEQNLPGYSETNL